MPIKEPYQYERYHSKNSVDYSDLELRIKYKSKTMCDFVKYAVKIMIEKSERSLFEFRKIFLYGLIFEEPDKTDNIAKDYLKKYSSYMDKLRHNLLGVSSWGDDIDEITDLC